MDHRMLRKTVALFMAVLLLGCAQTAGAAGKKIKDCACFSLEDKNFPLFYIPSTLPAGVTTDEWEARLNIYQTVIWGDAEALPEEYAESCEITVLSGNEEVKDAFVLESGRYEGSGEFYSKLKLDSEKLTKPGKTKIRIRLESEHFVLEKEINVKVVSWDEHPAYSFKEGDHTLRTTVGETLSYGAFAQVLAVDRIREASAAMADADEEIYGNGWITVEQNDPASWEVLEQQRTEGGYTGNYKVVKAGNCDMDVTLYHGNIKYTDKVHVVALAYELEGPGTLKPGETAVYSVKDMESGSRRTFTMSAEGEGISFDAETGTLTVPESVPSGTVITVTATPDAGEPVSKAVTVTSGCFQELEFRTIEREGFRIPVPAGEGWQTEEYQEGQRAAFYTESTDGRFVWSGEFYLPSYGMVSTDEEAEAEYVEDAMFDYQQKNIESAYVTIDGHRARVWVFENYNDSQFYGHTAILRYVRDNRVLYILFVSMAGEGGTPENTPRITLDDMRRVADNMGYDEAKAPIVASDAAITVTEKNNATAVSAGKSLQFTAAFGNPDRVNKAIGNNGIRWVVLKANGDECKNEAAITDKGQLTTDKALTEPVELVVQARSGAYGTVGEYRVTVLPAAKAISAEPADLFFYTGTDVAQTVQARLDPESVPPVGLTWELKGKAIVEITDSGNGSAEIRPLQAGKGTVTVKEPGGKSAKINIVVGDPVTAVALSAKGKAKPGGTVTLAAKLTPAKPVNKAVEWSVDVGEDVATINEKGQLKIQKGAAEGTVITVTCKALGAPEPITETIQVTVGQ